MKSCLSFVLLCLGAFLGAQSLPNNGFIEYETIPCPFDPSVTVNAYKDWLLYQTLDGTWQGPIDSSRCISLSDNEYEGILLSGVDLDKPLFIRCKLNDNNKILLVPDFLYTATGQVFGNVQTIGFVDGLDCPGNLCTGLFIGIEVPDGTGTGTTMRWYVDTPSGQNSTGIFETCVPTEYFNGNYLREFIFKLTFSPVVQPSQKLIANNANFYWISGPDLLSEVIAPQSTFNGASYEVPISLVSEMNNLYGANTYLIRYANHSTWPSSATPYYVEGSPEVNMPTQQTINLIVSPDETLVPQPFTYLRGALAAGSDSLRHHLNLLNNGGDICMSSFFELIFEDGSNYIHQGGHLNFEGPSACMMFRQGSSLAVPEGTTFQYGQSGRGILGLQQGGTIRLGKGSTLLIENTLWLQGKPTPSFPDPQIYLELNHGSTLAFGELARITNAFSPAEGVRLNVYMKGGILDDRKLDPASRLLIHRIYPKPSRHFSENLRVLQNPVPGNLQIDYVSEGNERVIIEIHDLQGRLVWTKPFDALEGHNLFDCELGNEASGAYMATLRSVLGKATAKVLKL